MKLRSIAVILTLSSLHAFAAPGDIGSAAVPASEYLKNVKGFYLINSNCDRSTPGWDMRNAKACLDGEGITSAFEIRPNFNDKNVESVQMDVNENGEHSGPFFGMVTHIQGDFLTIQETEAVNCGPSFMRRVCASTEPKVGGCILKAQISDKTIQKVSLGQNCNSTLRLIERAKFNHN